MTQTPDAAPFDAHPAAPATGILGDRNGTTASVAASPEARLTDRVEWQTVALAGAIYAGWAAAVVAGGRSAVPLWLWAPLAAWCVAWQASLQHEVIHGHPTPSAGLNRWIAGPPLTLWLSYERYRETHMQHHVDERLTDPLEDPESFYVSGRTWDRIGPLHRGLLVALNTLAGRLILGPLWTVGRFAISEIRRLRRRGGRSGGPWVRHAVQAAAVAALVDGVAGGPIWLYLVAVVWPATSLMLLRSFAEHRPAELPAHRSAIVESRGPLAWLYLSNNLHALHHERPGLAWYVLAKIYRANRDAVLERNGGFRLSGYREVARRWLWAPRDHPRHPGRGV